MENKWLGLEDKVVAVTGAAGGMGEVICEEFAKQGAHVVLLDIKEEAVNKLSKELNNKYDGEFLPFALDTTDEAKVDQAVEAVKEEFGRIDILVNTAAILDACPLEDLSIEDWQRSLDINLTGYFLMSQRFGRVMLEQKKGTMVHISTVGSIFPETYSAGYSVTKAGVNLLSRLIAAEWGKYGIRSNCVMPGMVMTPLSESFYANEEIEQGRSRLTANRRIGKPDDIASAVLYLASDRSDYTNGHELAADGGFSIMMQDMIPKPGGRREFALKTQENRKKK